MSAPVPSTDVAEMLSTYGADHMVAATCSLHLCSARGAWLCMGLEPFLTLLILLQMLTIDQPLPAANLNKHPDTESHKEDTIVVRHRHA